MAASGLPVGVIPVVDVLDIARQDAEALTEQQMPFINEWASWDWKKSDIGVSPGVAVTASRQVLGGDVRALCGWALTETTGTATAAVRFHDGSATTAEVFARINLAANESNREYPTRRGIECATGRVYLEVISGSVEGVIYWR